MVKIRISYNKEQEIIRIIKVLSPVMTGAKIKQSENGTHKKIYIELQ